MNLKLGRDSAGSRNIAIAYIDHAVSLVRNFNMDLSGKELHQLDDFKEICKELGGGEGLPSSPSLKFKSVSSKYSESVRNFTADKEFQNFDVLATEVCIFAFCCSLIVKSYLRHLPSLISLIFSSQI